MSSGFLNHPQKLMIIISSIGIGFSDLVQLIATFLYFFNGLNTDADIIIVILLAILLLQIVISTVFIIMRFTCWRSGFFEEIFKSFSRRLFYFADIIISHIIIIVFGLMIINIQNF